MITLLIGHRGVGKTRFLRRLTIYLREAGKNARILDLDAEIERREGKSIPDIFSQQGEAAFRTLEEKHFETLLAENAKGADSVLIALGAGFPLRALSRIRKSSPPFRCLWIRRPSDSSGRIFLDRPRLSSERSAYDEYLERYRTREPLYREAMDQELTIPEGFDSPNPWEKAWALGTLGNIGGTITLLPHCFRNPALLKSTLESKLLGDAQIELRDDLLDLCQLQSALLIFPPERCLLSFRRNPRANPSPPAPRAPAGVRIDWPAEWGIPRDFSPTVLSSHCRLIHPGGAEPISDSIDRFMRVAESLPRSILKLALPTHCFSELWEGHQWAMADPGQRAFLPMSPDGRWKWYRLLMKGIFPLNFWREGEGSAPDQPFLLDWTRTPSFDQRREGLRFAAILGDPVSHSRTPAEQWDFFSERGLPVFAIRVTPEEWENGALETLRRLGLRAAAVTSPLKGHAFKSASFLTETATQLEAVNTLAWSENEERWHGTNTDLEGLEHLLKLAIPPSSTIAVWGGGGTLGPLRALLPNAAYFSARTGEIRTGGIGGAEGVSSESFYPEVVIWGVGRSRHSDSNLPPPNWKPKIVVDLNYAADSPGIEYALKTRAKYISGLEMFRAQAQGQRRYWQSF